MCSDVRIGKGGVFNWISMMITEVKSLVLVVFISELMEPGNDVGWDGKRSEFTMLDVAASTEV